MKKLMLFLILLIFTACSNDDNPVSPELNAKNGIYILSEGVMGSNNSLLSYHSFEDKTTTLDAFRNANNNSKLGDSANDMEIYNKKIYIVVSNSKKIEVLDSETFERIETITFQTEKTPREIEIINGNYAYVTSWHTQGNGFVDKIDLSNNTIINSIEAGVNPETITFTDNKLFVGNIGENIVTVINTDDDSVVKNITVGFNPNSIESKDKDVYVTSVGGWQAGQERKGLFKINTETLTIVDSIVTDTFPLFPGESCLMDNSLLVVSTEGAYKINLDDFTLGNLFIDKSDVAVGGGAWSNIYSISYDSFEQKLYCGNPKDYSSEGDVAVLNKDGSVVDRIPAGISPGTILIVNK